MCSYSRRRRKHGPLHKMILGLRREAHWRPTGKGFVVRRDLQGSSANTVERMPLPRTRHPGGPDWCGGGLTRKVTEIRNERRLRHPEGCCHTGFSLDVWFGVYDMILGNGSPWFPGLSGCGESSMGYGFMWLYLARLGCMAEWTHRPQERKLWGQASPLTTAAGDIPFYLANKQTAFLSLFFPHFSSNIWNSF